MTNPPTLSEAAAMVQRAIQRAWRQSSNRSPALVTMDYGAISKVRDALLAPQPARPQTDTSAAEHLTEGFGMELRERLLRFPVTDSVRRDILR
ncbi:MAG: hypothetical protein B7733_08475, partial [Myxococcales bacterium FL481]